MHPKVFVSHASEDRDRFVLGFAARLRARGIDAWLDRWEMLPGDSFVRRIFDEGLADAQAVVIVLSRHSVDKPWVREEIDAAVVHRIQRGCRLVPVLIDDCAVPPSLVATLWERIENLGSYDASLDRIVAAITGLREKPPLGPTPADAQPPDRAIVGLAALEARVLRALGDRVVADGSPVVGGDDLAASPSLATLDAAGRDEALQVLEAGGLVEVTRFLGPEPPEVRITTLGLQRHGRASLPDYAGLVAAVASAVANEGVDTNEALATRLDRPRPWIDHALDVLAARGELVVSRYGGGLAEVVAVQPSLRRALAAGAPLGRLPDPAGQGGGPAMSRIEERPRGGTA